MSNTDPGTRGLPRRPAPGWVAPVFALLGAATIPWTIYLSVTLPQRMDTGYYRTAWVGFDVMLVLGLLTTAYTAWRGQQRVGLVAMATATLLVVDAWFDLTLSSRAEMLSAVLSAALVELPLAVVCGWIALHVDRLVARRLHRLARRAARLQAETVALKLDEPGRRGMSRLQYLLREQAHLRRDRGQAAAVKDFPPDSRSSRGRGADPRP
ncbi:hypothetical protein ACWT_3184 [Actinoplanes sp. SE50]|uniref:hypothetical protein n=1 Tax=unclassified Actinoplanes TaxID=2626549 RepID=UPI00023EC7A9|nr:MULTISPECIES: hypothetical protein [unclassified Actinoplanes]AEV84207.1 hypothetical protein ACPL_3312 [Actinoplanes sp. SE50/110]ATO82599.1 hypothetical protein ACWT_3184 [Actinoplanes sp. SE50]SLM00006.1 hypothetical protein ACSP50_3238 [Actinoplanes sp. SE50/110]